MNAVKSRVCEGCAKRKNWSGEWNIEKLEALQISKIIAWLSSRNGINRQPLLKLLCKSTSAGQKCS